MSIEELTNCYPADTNVCVRGYETYNESIPDKFTTVGNLGAYSDYPLVSYTCENGKLTIRIDRSKGTTECTQLEYMTPEYASKHYH